MEKSTKYVICGLSAGTAAAFAPIACGMQLARGQKGLGEDDFLSVSGTGFVTRDSRSFIPVGLDLSPDELFCTDDAEEFYAGRKQIFDRLAERFGNYGAREIFARYAENYISKADIKAIAKTGINIVRIPVSSYLIFKPGKLKKAEPSLDRLEKLVKALGKAEIYSILSLERAPGIGDGETGFLEEGKEGAAFRKDTVTIWKKISERFKDEPAVAAYDLLDTGSLGIGAKKLCGEFYTAALKALRAAGDNHIALMHLDTLPEGINAREMNAALAVSRNYCSQYDSAALAEKLAAASASQGAPVILSGLRVSSFADAFPLFAEKGIYGIAAKYKGSGNCLYAGMRPVIDLKLDNFDSMNEKLKSTAGVKNYTPDKSLISAVKAAASGAYGAADDSPEEIQ